MQSDLDREFAGVMAALTAPGAMFACASVEVRGVAVPAIVAAPPTLPAYFAHFCAQHADATFLVDGNCRLSFAETYAAARKVAGGLVAGHGLVPGDRVGIAARNSAAWIVAYMGVIMAGGCATLLNGWWQGGELAQGIALAGCRFVLADAGRAKRLDGQTVSATILHIAHDCPPLAGLSALTAKGGDETTPLPELGPESLATILFTSGSTGAAKGAWSDHRAVVQGTFSFLAQTVAVLGVLTAHGQAPTGQPATLVNLPLFHVTGEVPVLLQSFALGRKLVVMPKWDAEEAMRLIEKEKISYFVGVPLMSYEIAAHPNRAKYDLSSCTTFAAGGAPRPVEHVARLRQELPGAWPIIGYGLTETNATGTGNFNENYVARPASSGMASRPLVELAILDDAGALQPAGSIGEVALRSVCNFGGYWENEAATAAAMTADGWFRSGDLGVLDADGYLTIVDRKKDIIIRGGENISCIEVEGALYADDRVAEAAVFGLPDPLYGEVPAAVVVPKSGAMLDEAGLLAALAPRLAAFKLPVRIVVRAEALPRLGSEKVDKRALRDLYASVPHAQPG